MRAASCRKQPKTNSTPHRGTILIQALPLPCVLKTVSSPYLHKPHNSRLHPTYANTDSVCVCERVCTCYHRTLPELLVCHFLVSTVLMYSVTFTWWEGGGGCSNSTALRFNLQRFIDVEYVLLFAHFIAASCFVADGGPLWMRCCCFWGWPVYVWN